MFDNITNCRTDIYNDPIVFFVTLVIEYMGINKVNVYYKVY